MAWPLHKRHRFHCHADAAAEIPWPRPIPAISQGSSGATHRAPTLNGSMMRQNVRELRTDHLFLYGDKR